VSELTEIERILSCNLGGSDAFLNRKRPLHPLTTHLPDAPASLQQFFERALSSKTAERPRSAQEFIFTLQRAFAFRDTT
jgi:hypothetical protein